VLQVPQAVENFVREHRRMLAQASLRAVLDEHLRQLVTTGMIAGVHALHCLCLVAGASLVLPDEAFELREAQQRAPELRRETEWLCAAATGGDESE
jgi:precorrin-2 methylase